MTALPAENLTPDPLPQHNCLICWDAPTCNLEANATDKAGCLNWRCQVCRGPILLGMLKHDRCMATGVPNGITYHDGTHRAPFPDANGHFYSGTFCKTHQSWRCGLAYGRTL
jgi:hypothetical protein